MEEERIEDERNEDFFGILFEFVLVFLFIIFSLLLFGHMKDDRNDVTPTPVPTMTATPTPTNTPTPTAVPTATPTPTPSPSPTPTPVPSVRKDVGQGHKFKPYTRHYVYGTKGTAQGRLQAVAYTDERTGIRLVDDPFGNPRYCVALGTYWCGGHPEHIGRCVDVHMVNGAVLRCVLADVKRQEDTKNGANRYGEVNNDVLEFIVDGSKLPASVDLNKGGNGNVSSAGKEFEGDAEYMIVYDLWIEGFGKEK